MSDTPEIKNAVINSTMLGVEDHGILSCFIHLQYDGGGQGFGGYAMDSPTRSANPKDERRVGTAWGMEFIRRVLDVVGVNNWEDLKGKHVRVKATFSKVESIGNIIKDKWFTPETDINHLRP